MSFTEEIVKPVKKALLDCAQLLFKNKKSKMKSLSPQSAHAIYLLDLQTPAILLRGKYLARSKYGK